MLSSLIPTKVRNFLTKKRIIGTIPTVQEIIKNDISTINNSLHKDDYLTQSIVELYDEGELETAFEIARIHK